MAGTRSSKKEKPYELKGITKEISASSRVSIKIRDNYYTVEYSETRVIPEVDGVDLEKERQALWEIVNNECDNQALEIKNTFSK